MSAAEDRARSQERAERAEFHHRYEVDRQVIPWDSGGGGQLLADATDHQDRAADWARELREIAERDGQADPAHVARATEYLHRSRALITGLERRAEEQGGLQRRELRAAREALARLRELSPTAARPSPQLRGGPRPPSDEVRALHALTPTQARAHLRAAADAVTALRGPAGLLRCAVCVAPLVVAGHVDADEAVQVIMTAVDRLYPYGRTADDDDAARNAIREGLATGGRQFVDREM